MSTEPTPLELRVELLEAQLQQLSKQVADLKQTAPEIVTSKRHEPPQQVPVEEFIPNEATLLVGSSSLLMHVSALSFLLVIALGLRAMADNGVIGMQIGTLLGMAYAAALISAGYLFYHRKHSIAPLLTTTGGLLMCSVLVETYTRFSSLPVEAVYIMLAITGICMAAISYLQHTSVPIIVGTFGICIAAVAIDYPNPYFPYLGLLLWLSNILGFFATRVKRCSWLRWFLLFTTHFMLQIWGLKLSGLFKSGNPAEHLSPDWFIPIITLIGFTFMMISLFGIIRSGDEKISKFDFSLPAVNAGWCYIAGIYALKDPTLFGAPATGAAIIHFGLVFWLADRKRGNAAGTSTFTAGGIILACLSLPALMNDMLLPLPILSALAFTVCYYAQKWASGGMRMASYFLQAYVSFILIAELISNGIERPALAFTLTIICGLIATFHYRFSRQHQPPERSEAFKRLDKRDQTALLPLFAGLTNMFFAALAVTHLVLQQVYTGDFEIAFIASQTILMNLAAIFLIALAAMRHNKELRNTAILVMLIAGAKAFILDMFKISGTWLVFSIFAFGIAAALTSLILARWKTEPNEQQQPEVVQPVEATDQQ